LNCGSCGHVCAAEKPVCLSGCCTLGCIYPYTDCGVSVCKNLKTDPANCGMCGVRCDSGKTCVDMSCVP
jgi:hypothetical protein